MRRVSPLVVTVLTLGAGACAPTRGPAVGPVASPAGAGITPDELRRDLFVFASDSFRGRETGTPDAMRAAAFLGTRLAALGVEPRGDSGYFQRVPLVAHSFATSSAVTVVAGGTTTRLPLGTAVAPLVSLGPGTPPTKLNAEGDLVFGGYGLAIPTMNRDDLAGLNVEGKVVVVVNAAPPGAEPRVRKQLEGQVPIGLRVGRLLQMRPAAIVIVLAGESADFFQQAAPELLRSVTLAGARDLSNLSEAQRVFPPILLAAAAPGSPLLPAGWPRDDRPRALGRRLTVHLRELATPVTGYNVVGTVRGRDATLAATFVAFGAHYDHIGVGVPVAGDSINNGADDDGSGSVSLLAIARSFVQSPRPRRSALFVWHVGEEKGLLGSQWFTDHPTVPIDSIVAQLNADMIGRNGRDSLFVVGPAAAPNGQSRVLGTIVDSVNAHEPRPFVLDRQWDSPTHPEQIYYRSDHFNYARKGIPIVFLTTGLHADYHKPSDEASKIDYEKMARVATLMRDVGKAVAERPTRPKP